MPMDIIILLLSPVILIVGIFLWFRRKKSRHPSGHSPVSYSLSDDLFPHLLKTSASDWDISDETAPSRMVHNWNQQVTIVFQYDKPNGSTYHFAVMENGITVFSMKRGTSRETIHSFVGSKVPSQVHDGHFLRNANRLFRHLGNLLSSVLSVEENKEASVHEPTAAETSTPELSTPDTFRESLLGGHFAETDTFQDYYAQWSENESFSYGTLYYRNKAYFSILCKEGSISFRWVNTEHADFKTVEPDASIIEDYFHQQIAYRSGAASVR